MKKLATVAALLLVAAVSSAQQETARLPVRGRVRELPTCVASMPTGTPCVWGGATGYVYDPNTTLPTHVFALMIDPSALPEYNSPDEKLISFSFSINALFGAIENPGDPARWRWASSYGVIGPIDVPPPPSNATSGGAK